MPVSCRNAGRESESSRSRDPADPQGAWPSRISLPPASPPPPSSPAFFAVLLEERRTHRSWKQLPPPRAPTLSLANRSHFLPPSWNSRSGEAGRPLENSSPCDAFRRSHPAGTDLLIARTAGHRELNCCLPLFSVAVGGSFSKGTFYSLFSMFFSLLFF